MSDLTTILFFFSLLFIPSFIINLYLDSRIIFILKNFHEPIWTELGKPTYVLRDLTRHHAFKSFLKQGRFNNTGDETLINISNLFMKTSMAHNFILVVFLILFIIALIR